MNVVLSKMTPSEIDALATCYARQSKPKKREKAPRADNRK